MQMMLGTFLFDLQTASYQSLSRQSPRRFAEQERVGAAPVLQDLGSGVETLSLPGIIVPELFGSDSLLSLDALRTMEDTGDAHLLIQMDAAAWNGTLLGLWVIDDINETQSEFFGALPQKIEFELSLKRYET